MDIYVPPLLTCGHMPNIVVVVGETTSLSSQGCHLDLRRRRLYRHDVAERTFTTSDDVVKVLSDDAGTGFKLPGGPWALTACAA